MTAYDDALAELKAGKGVMQSPGNSRYAPQRDYRRRYYSAATIDRLKAEWPLYWDRGEYRMIPEGFTSCREDQHNRTMLPVGTEVITWEGRSRILVAALESGMVQAYRLPRPAPATSSSDRYDEARAALSGDRLAAVARRTIEEAGL